MARAGDSIEDFCRACKLDRMHTVVAADPEGAPIRVACGYCSSEHNYRGGPRMGPASTRTNVNSGPGPGPAREAPSSERRGGATRSSRGDRPDRQPFPVVSERERTAPPMSVSDEPDLEMLLRRIIRDEGGITPVAPAE